MDRCCMVVILKDLIVPAQHDCSQRIARIFCLKSLWKTISAQRFHVPQTAQRLAPLRKLLATTLDIGAVKDLNLFTIEPSELIHGSVFAYFLTLFPLLTRFAFSAIARVTSGDDFSTIISW
uniref:Uncharacterized protein n=1 Tax=Spongospora subterranea TaxID=70186 RepID=A0A0H5QVK1_9EUKA|eukprot:CRZ06018.1 hypothetical protein [Spongospora subterranea]